MLVAAPISEKDAVSTSMPGSGNGAFHSHSFRDLTAGHGGGNGKKYRGLHTEAAREVSESRRSLSSTTTCGYCGIFDEDLGTIVPNSSRRKSRRNLFGGVSYGAASVKRGFGQDLDTDKTAAFTLYPATGDSIRSTSSSSRRRSISAGEGAWLVRGNLSRRRKSSRSSIMTYEKKDSDEFTPDIEEPESEKNNREVQFSTNTNIRGAPSSPKTDREVQFPTNTNIRSAASSPKTNRAVQFPTSTTIRGAPSSPKTNRSVQFSTVSIWYHHIILGNNPFVTSGPPLELAWEHEPGATESDIPIDRYETSRSPHRRSEWDLILSRGERESRLLESGFTREEIAAAIRETSRVKAQRANTVLNLKMAGFEEFTDNIRRQTAKMVGLRKSSEWMYNDWKKNNAACRRTHFSDTRAESIFQREGDRAAAAMGPSSSEPVPFEGKRSISPGVRHAIQTIIHRGSSPLFPMMEEERPESANVYTGPAFGITRMSLSSRVGFGNYDGCDANEGYALPFAVIKVVYPASPAHDAGLCRGDRLIKLGSITALNHDHCRAIPELGQVAATKECSIPVVVEDDHGVRRNVTIWPHKW
eukprot:CAMPEP_0172316558 /NCGR_PEP_ID=MMETSP1058-20130122/28666_1 /TAXON_ID=83371 /ORGANISM="Detonula confervacea, Strain CCMP 353" /LENGTH=584 /DNA_ID=CAMNT_0013030895 /DNA_START=155 /DNA_END=1906 /DNA_ORIENTATION=-